MREGATTIAPRAHLKSARERQRRGAAGDGFARRNAAPRSRSRDRSPVREGRGVATGAAGYAVHTARRARARDPIDSPG
jgi:hypothetical protein